MNERQRWIARSLALGEPVNQIAEELGITPRIVRHEIAKMYGLTGLDSYTQLACWCISQGLVSLPELQEVYSHVQLGPTRAW